MKYHDHITLIGGQYIGKLKKHASLKGSYTVIRADESIPSNGKVVIVYTVQYLMCHNVKLKGVIMVRYHYSFIFKGKQNDALYRNLFLNSSMIEKIYWHVDNGGLRGNRKLQNIYNIFNEEIRFLLELRGETYNYHSINK